MRSNELSVECRDRIVLRNRSREGYQNISAALKVPKNTVASIILKWESFVTTKTEQSREKGLGQGGDQEPDGHSDRALEFLCGDGRTFQKDNHLCSTPPFRINQDQLITNQDRDKDERSKYKEILDENLLQSAQDLRLVHLLTGQ